MLQFLLFMFSRAADLASTHFALNVVNDGSIYEAGPVTALMINSLGFYPAVILNLILSAISFWILKRYTRPWTIKFLIALFLCFSVWNICQGLFLLWALA